MSWEDIAFPLETDPFLAREIGEDEDEHLDDRYKTLAKKIFGEDEEKRQILIKELKENILAQKWNIPVRKAVLIKILRAGNFTIEGSMKVLNNYLDHLQSCPQYFADPDPLRMKPVSESGVVTLMNQRDQFGRRVMAFIAGKWNPDDVHVNDLYCFSYMLSELMAVEPKTQIAGVTAVVDAQGFGYKQLRGFTLEDAKNVATFVQECFPLWFRSIEIVRAPYVFSLAYNVIKPFLSQRIKDSIVFHKNFEQLYNNVPKEVLPQEFGGDQGPFRVDECYEKLKEMESFFNEVKLFKK